MSDRLEAIRQAAQTELQRSPAASPWWHGAVILAGVNVALAAAMTLLLPAHHEQHTGPWARWSVGGLLAVLGALGAVAAVRPGGRALRQALLASVVLTMGLTLAGASGYWVNPLLGGAACGMVEFVSAVVPVLVTTVVLSQFALDPGRAVLGGLAAGAGGLLGLHLSCPVGTIGHLVLFHLVPWALVGLAALGLRRIWRTKSFAP